MRYLLVKSSQLDNVKEKKREGSDGVLLAFFSAETVVDIEDVVVIFIIIPIVVNRLAGFCEDTTRIVSCLISELRIANIVCLR